LDINELKGIGAIVSAAPIKENIAWTMITDEGEEVSHSGDVFVLKMSYSDLYRIYNEEKSEDESPTDAQLRHDVATIRAGVRFGEKLEQLSIDDCYRLHQNLRTALNGAISKHNRFTKKSSPQPTTSGTS
jgi:RNA polymerase-interacting CarD/CdnL/TRCF family regulator